MLEYEWENSAAALMLFDEQSAVNNRTTTLLPEPQYNTLFDHYNAHNIGSCPGDATTDYFLAQQQLLPHTSAALFSPSPSLLPYGLQQPSMAASIGLDLGVGTYFSSLSRPEVRNRRRRTKIARCQAEGCGADLSYARHYHRRHKVCEFHSKAAVVVLASRPQRFCQQCSRFHVLAEFDQGKRSCRKRLADHNRRRRKSQDLITSNTSTQVDDNVDNNVHINSANTSSTTTTTTTAPKPEMVLFTTSSSSNTTLSAAMQMPSLELGCGTSGNNAIVEAAQGPTIGLSILSSHVETSPPSMTYFSQFGEYHHGGNEQRFAGNWDEDEDGCSLRELFQMSK